MFDFLVDPDLTYWLILSAALFSIGLYGFFTKTNAIAVLMCVELMLNAVAINFISFNRYVATENLDGQIMGIFIIAVAAAEVVVGMAIIVQLFASQKHLNVSKMKNLKG